MKSHTRFRALITLSILLVIVFAAINAETPRYTPATLAASFAPARPPQFITEDSPRWDCSTMGNRQCGPYNGTQDAPRLQCLEGEVSINAVRIAGPDYSHPDPFAGTERSGCIHWENLLEDVLHAFGSDSLTIHRDHEPFAYSHALGVSLLY